MSQEHSSIGLADLIEQVKKELLSAAPGKDANAPFLFVESIDLELQVEVSKGGDGGIKIDVLSVGGTEVGGNVSHSKVQTVKVKLTSLFDRQQLIELYKATHSNDVMAAIQQNMTAVLKGDDQESADNTVV